MFKNLLQLVLYNNHSHSNKSSRAVNYISNAPTESAEPKKETREQLPLESERVLSPEMDEKLDGKEATLNQVNGPKALDKAVETIIDSFEDLNDRQITSLKNEFLTALNEESKYYGHSYRERFSEFLLKKGVNKIAYQISEDDSLKLRFFKNDQLFEQLNNNIVIQS